MADNLKPVGLNSFFGGISIDSKLGSTAQFYDEYHTDFRSNPSNISVLPQPADASNGVVTDLIQAMDQINSGVRYALGDAGRVYRVSTAGVWSYEGSIGENGGAGLAYRADVDHIYIAGTTKLARITRASSLAKYEPNWFSYGQSTCTTCYKTGGTAAYTLLTAISELAQQKRTFTADIEPLYQIGVKVTNKGTGDWTLTLHDDANNVLGTVTVTNANLKNNQINYFVFSSPVRIQRGDDGGGSALTYHFHLTSTVADGVANTTTAGSLADCDMELWATALVSTQNGLHPVGNFTNLTLIGNGNYLASYEPLQDSPTTADFNRHRLTFPPGFEVCGFAQKNLMFVIGCEKRSSSGEFQEGALFFWDGVADTYNDWWPVPEGSPESLFSTENTVLFIANGALYEVRGSDQPIKLRTIRGTNSDYSGRTDSTHCYPNMMTVRRGLLLFGFPSYTTNQSLNHNVYSYGVISREYPLSFGRSYTISTGTELNNGTNNLRLGMVKNYGDTLYISWRDDSATPRHYGVDVVDNSSVPASTFGLTALVFDDSRAWAYKEAAEIVCTFDPAPADTTLTIKYRIDDDSDWTYSTQTISAGDQYLVLPVYRRFLVLTYGFDGTSGDDSLVISSFYAWINPLANERHVG